MTFQIISVGWRCGPWWRQTLQSVEDQSIDDWAVHVVYDGGDDAGPEIEQWCAEHGDRWSCTLNREQYFAVRNQAIALEALAPAPDDVVVFLDLDGDRLAHPDVLAHLTAYYADATLVTYGNYEPVPAEPHCPPATEFPTDVVTAGAYRAHMLGSGGECHFNHLRTMKGRVATAIPDDQFHWPDGRWYESGCDYVFMVCALELAGGRHKCLSEILLTYNHANPQADYLVRATETAACVVDFLHRPPLAPLAPILPGGVVEQADAQLFGRENGPEDVITVPPSQPFLPPEQRRQILREYGQRFGLRVFIETGTNDGGTPWELKHDFDKLYTIELGEKPWLEALDKFALHQHVVCLHGDSATVLPAVLVTVDQPALIWLDGHWSGGDTARGSQDTPVLVELQAIFETGRDHVVLVDDARLFDGMPLHAEQPGWPHIDEVRKLAAENGYTYELADDIIRLTP